MFYPPNEPDGSLPDFEFSAAIVDYMMRNNLAAIILRVEGLIPTDGNPPKADLIEIPLLSEEYTPSNLGLEGVFFVLSSDDGITHRTLEPHEVMPAGLGMPDRESEVDVSLAFIAGLFDYMKRHNIQELRLNLGAGSRESSGTSNSESSSPSTGAIEIPSFTEVIEIQSFTEDQVPSELGLEGVFFVVDNAI